MSRTEQVRQLVWKRISWLETLQDQSKQKAMLAELRRGVGRKPGDVPQLWALLFEDMPEELTGNRSGPSAAEWAISTSLTLYAFHQQGKDPALNSMNCVGQGIGCAAARLVRKPDEDLKRVQSRFNRFAMASDMVEAVTYLRAIVSMLRAESVGLDYARLAGELYNYQNDEKAADIRLSWGRDFYRNIKIKEEDKNNE